jgi:hypothetical protein
MPVPALRLLEIIGAPGTIRTSDPQIRSLMLYPAELRARGKRSPSRMSQPAQPRCGRRAVGLEPVAMLRASLFTVFALGGCMAPANPPSLAPRAIEMRADAVDPVPSMPPAQPLDSSLASRIAALLAEATAGDADFAKSEASGSSALAAGRKATEGSEAWIGAQAAQSALEVARQRTAAALGEVDSLVVAQAEAVARDPSTGGLSELQAAQAVIEAMVNRQTARIEQLTR